MNVIEWPVAGKIGIPFMIAGVTAAKINNTRVVEAVVIAVISSGIMAGFGYYVALPVLQEQMMRVRVDMLEIKSDVKDVRILMDGRSQRRDAREAEAARRR